MKTLLVIILTISSIAFGQFQMLNTGPASVAPVQGAWVEYDFVSTDGEQAEIRYAIVGTDECGDAECYWFEYRIKDKNTNDRSIFKILTAGDPNQTQYTMRMITQTNDETPIELSYTITDEQMSRIEEEAESYEANFDDIDNMYADIGTERITVPAGTFNCHRLEIKDENERVTGTYWISTEIAFMGLVKSVVDDQGEMVLTGHGASGAETEITGTPEVIVIPTSADEYFQQLGESAKEGIKEGVKEGVREGAREGARDATREGIRRGVRGIIGR